MLNLNKTMPYSKNYLDQEVKEFLKNHKLKKYLDIGAGAGKFGRMIREINPKSHIEAVEIEKDYIKKFKLDCLYNRIYNININMFIDNKIDYTCDICIIGDCIEHLKKSDGIDLLNFLVYRTKYILVKYPKKYIQYSLDGYKHEGHISIWTKQDFDNFEYKFKSENYMNLVIIKGYLHKQK